MLKEIIKGKQFKSEEETFLEFTIMLNKIEGEISWMDRKMKNPI